MSELPPVTHLPIDAVLQWFNDTCDDVAHHRSQLEGALAENPHREDSDAAVYDRGRLAGERQILTSFKAFVMSKTAELAGELDVSRFTTENQ